MGVRRSGSFRGRTGLRRLTTWDEGTGGIAVSAITASGAFFIGAAVQALGDGLTVIRQRGELTAILSVATSALDGFSGAFGIGKATSAAVLGGIANVPTPITEQSWDGWLYWTPIQVISPIAAQFDNGATVFRQTVDTKAMRKLSEDEALYAAWEGTEVGTATMSLFWDSRVLAKLP